MMDRRGAILIGVVAVVALALGMLIGGGLPVRTVPVSEAETPSTSPAFDAMHEACARGDVEAMTGAMNALTEEDWQIMQAHMGDGHHMGMGPGAMDGSMMGWSGAGMMTW